MILVGTKVEYLGGSDSVFGIYGGEIGIVSTESPWMPDGTVVVEFRHPNGGVFTQEVELEYLKVVE